MDLPSLARRSTCGGQWHIVLDGVSEPLGDGEIWGFDLPTYDSPGGSTDQQCHTYRITLATCYLVNTQRCCQTYWQCPMGHAAIQVAPGMGLFTPILFFFYFYAFLFLS